MPVVSWEYSGHLVLIQQSGLRPAIKSAALFAFYPRLRWGQPHVISANPLTTASLPSLVRAWASSVPTLVLAA